MKRILFTIAAFFTLGALATAQEKGPAITVVDSAIYDFGFINEVDGFVSHVFEILNNGEAPLVISRVIASCGCTTPQWTKEPIQPGQTGDIKVTYDPNGRPGKFTKTINVYSNGKTGSYVLTIKGEVVPK
jgi:hypothetical protein